jgi:hypothetical protein
MDRRQRVMLLGIAATIAVVAVVIALVAGGGDDDGDKSTSSTTSSTTAAQTTTETTPPEPQGATETIDIKDGEPDGGVKDVKLKKDDPLEITVNSDQELPIHFHGYDIEKDAAPGKPAVFKLKADTEGVFEIEIESTGTKIAKVTVAP